MLIISSVKLSRLLCPGHVVPGIDFTNDPLLQARLFSYTDTQLSRLGGPNFHQIPINKPVCPFHNNQRDGLHQRLIHTGQANYEPNSIDDNWPAEAPGATQAGGFESYQERIDGNKIRQRSESFNDHFTHARLFYQSQAPHEQKHIIDAYVFELSKVQRQNIREREVLEVLCNIDLTLAQQVADQLGIEIPAEKKAAKLPDVLISKRLSLKRLNLLILRHVKSRFWHMTKLMKPVLKLYRLGLNQRVLWLMC